MSDKHTENVICNHCGRWTSACICEAPSELAPARGCAATWSVKPLFAWYDCWVGIFWDSRKRKLYILPLPCVGVVIEFLMRHNDGTKPLRAGRKE